MFNCLFRALAAVAALLVASAVEAGSSGVAHVTLAGLSAGGAARQVRGAHPSGVTAHRIESGGIQRGYVMYLPKNRDAGKPLPVVIDFHGSGSDPYEEMQVTGMADAAERYGFVLLMPKAAVAMPAGGRTWNVPPDDQQPDDVRFAMDVLGHAAERMAIDRNRVYATGFSGGGRLASELACAAPRRIAAVGVVGGLRSPAGCEAEAIPVVAFHGSEDPINPYAGGGSDYWGYGVDAAVQGWVKRNGCATVPEVTRVSASTVEFRFKDCQRGAEVVLYRAEGGGHTWPGSHYPFPEERFGKSVSDVDATRVMLKFFLSRTRLRNGATEMTRPRRERIPG